MRPAGRIAAAIEILADVDARHRPVADALKDWGLSHRFAGSGDRAAIGNLVYDGLRWRRSSAFRAGEETPRGIILATLRWRWGVGTDDLARLAEERFGPGALSAEETAAFGVDHLGTAPLDVQADIPEWLAGAFEENFADEWFEEATALAARAPLDLRVNTLKAERARVLSTLSRHGASATPISPVGVRLPPRAGWERAPNIVREEIYQRGHVEVQDEASQIAALLVFARPGEQVLDLCAGAGGKTLAISAHMDNRGQIHATDADPNQLSPIYERLKRAGARNVQVHPAGSDLSALEGKMDRVLVDAPCSGSGTWRRRPETKWRLSEEALARRVEEQERVLEAARAYVRPGGYLVYVTCSVLPQENEAQVDNVLAQSPNFEEVSAGEAWEELFGVGGPKPWSANGMSLTMTPAATGTDGFFLAVMERMAD
ncbi:RsmB/NOP family class I SAM-dependent RNA methyltransferase [Acuticoccus sp. M5D2P5]|uniref:RsmB/NOP family class I SAM-dependent RNA methyltransferase n=1 Tax=Acuticoccus kalidii TaxID=2910977 RepID=UPI001F2A2B99|nr:RsmB/NOP family class I SAM-dependent RNA methyltransferase [Acuticoccus kalidii]MCF3934715.1 RsmB/NOP family class I SAM-dependent RNA methyltransferase [Acuticoccus kalidii]